MKANTKQKRLRLSLGRTLFLDLLLDQRTRPLFTYAAVMLAIGTFLFHWLEGWGWLDSFYFVVITLTTIGYGDFSPTIPLTKLITIFYGLNGVILLLMLFDVVRQLRGWTIESRSADKKS
jgi:voltage-gated potassium channel